MQTLFYYYKKTLEPFRSLMTLSAPEINAFMCAHLPEEGIFHKNPEGYIARRKATESWLRQAFCDRGGRPVADHPIYMTLGRSSYIESLGIYTECVQVPLAHFSEETISFTYPDSYVSRWLAETRGEYFNPEMHGRIFTLTDLPRLLADEAISNDAWKNHTRKYDFFIEAQIWDVEPLRAASPEAKASPQKFRHPEPAKLVLAPSKDL
jgi:hypothetical protein